MTKITHLQSIKEMNQEDEDFNKSLQGDLERLQQSYQDDADEMVNVENSMDLRESLGKKSDKKQSQLGNLKNIDSIQNNPFQEIRAEAKKNSLMSSKEETLPRESKVQNFDSFKHSLDNIQQVNPPDETLILTPHEQNMRQNT